MLVEDNSGDEVLTLRAFRKSNVPHEVAVARDGAEALDYLFGAGKYEGQDISPEVILLDLKLPRIDGGEVLRRLRAHERTKLTPVVVFTSSREEQDVVDSFKAGCNSFICKPVNFDQFVEVIKHIVTYWLLWNEPLPKI